MHNKSLLFVHDHIFTKKGDSVYSAAAFPYESWERYLQFFCSLEVVGRHHPRKGYVDDLVVSSGNSVRFHLLGMSSHKILGAILLRFKAKKMIESLVYTSSAVVARLPSENGNIAVEASRKAGKPVAVEVVGCAWDAYSNYGGVIAKLYAPIALYRMRRSVRNASQVLYVTSEYLQLKYPASPGTLSVSASNANIPEKFYADSRRLVRLYSPDEKLVLGLIGNFKTNYKGIDVAIEALGHLRSKGFDFSLKILGSGDRDGYKRICQRLGVGDHVEFCGSLPNGSAVISWLEGVDIYIQPSRTEGLPRALIEAMSQGKPCFGADVGGIPELISCPYIHRVGDSADLAEKVSAALEHGKLKSFNAENYKKSLEFSQDKLRNKRAKFFEALSKIV